MHRCRREYQRRRERRLQVRRNTAGRHGVAGPQAGREGLVPEAAHRQLRRHRCHLRDRGVHRPTRYAGPDLAKATVVGACRDAAGNTAEAGQAFQYDATAPKLPMAKAEVEKGVAKIVWQRSPDAVLVELERTPGITAGRRPSSTEATARASPTRRCATASATATRSGRATWRGTSSRRPSRRTSTCRRSTGRRPARQSTHRSSSPGRPSKERPSTTSSSTGTR